MSRIVHWLTDHSQIVVEALLHSLWISSVVGLLVWLALRQLSVKHSNLRYAIAAELFALNIRNVAHQAAVRGAMAILGQSR